MSIRTHVMMSTMLMAFPALATAANLDNWEGTFRGPCQNLRAGALPSTKTDFTMERTIAAIPGTNRYVWRSSYGSGSSVKDYELIAIDPARGRYQTDEGGGVLIDQYLSGNNFYSHFATGPVQITTLERLEGDTLIFELLSFESKVTASASPVDSFRFQVNQRCILKRV